MHVSIVCLIVLGGSATRTRARVRIRLDRKHLHPCGPEIVGNSCAVSLQTELVLAVSLSALVKYVWIILVRQPQPRVGVSQYQSLFFLLKRGAQQMIVILEYQFKRSASEQFRYSARSVRSNNVKIVRERKRVSKIRTNILKGIVQIHEEIFSKRFSEVAF